MTNFLKKEQQGIIAQLCSLEVTASKSSISPDLQKLLENHSKVFETPKGLPPIHDHDHAIHLTLRSVPEIIKPYLMARHLKVKIDHHGHKYFSEQILSSEEQQKWVTEVLDYDFEIIYFSRPPKSLGKSFQVV